MTQQRELENNDRKALVDEFRGKKFNDKNVADFCTRFKLPLVDAGSVQDFIYQQEYDERMSTVIPLVLAEIAKMQYAGEYLSDDERRRIGDDNDKISESIAVILEENGILYRETTFLKGLAGDIVNLMQTAENRVSNMCATVLAEMAVEKLGEPLSIKSLADERKQIADRKAKKIEEEKPEEEIAEDDGTQPMPQEEVAGGEESTPTQE